MQAFCNMVEMMGVEPMSENPLTKPSSWTVCYFRFPFGSVNRHTLRLGSPFMPDRFKGEPPVQVHCLFDAQSAVAVLRRGTGDPQVTALPSFTPKRKTQAAIATVSLSFIFRIGQFTRLPSSPRLSCLRIPVETFTPPYVNQSNSCSALLL